MNKIKCVYFLDWRLNDRDIAILLFLRRPPIELQGSKQQNGYISVILPPIKKIRALYFVQLQKLNKIRWPYFLDRGSNDWDIAVLLFWPLLPAFCYILSPTNVEVAESFFRLLHWNWYFLICLCDIQLLGLSLLLLSRKIEIFTTLFTDSIIDKDTKISQKFSMLRCLKTNVFLI